MWPATIWASNRLLFLEAGLRCNRNERQVSRPPLMQPCLCKHNTIRSRRALHRVGGLGRILQQRQQLLDLGDGLLLDLERLSQQGSLL